MAILAASILNSDLTDLAGQLRLAEMGGADWIHCDIMDGHFVPNITFGPVLVEAVNRVTSLPIDVHLMIEKPDKFLEKFAEAGANSISVHYENVIHLNRTITRIKELGLKAGVVINPATPVDVLKDTAEYVDLVLIMSVNPGFGGQSFIPNSLMKIRDALKLRQNVKANFLIEVDGGIEVTNAKDVLEAGCDVFIIGSSIFKSENISAAAVEFKNIISK
jgi:ribulose-phosphate 3-epimerase